MNDSEIDLRQFDTEFDQAVCEDRDLLPIPDGKYNVIVERVEVARSQTSGNPMLKWTLRVTGPQHQNRLIWKNNVIAPNNLKYLKADLSLCGMNLVKLSDLRDRLGELLDVALTVTKKTVGDYSRIYFNRRLTTANGQRPARAPLSDALDRF